MSNLEIRKEVRSTIKSLGFDIKDFSCSVKIAGYSLNIIVKCKNESLTPSDFAKLQTELAKFQKVDRNQWGEILAGGNAYIQIQDCNNRTCDWTWLYSKKFNQ